MMRVACRCNLPSLRESEFPDPSFSCFFQKKIWVVGAVFLAFFRLFLRGVTERLRIFGWFFVVNLWCLGGEIVVGGSVFFGV